MKRQIVQGHLVKDPLRGSIHRGKEREQHELYETPTESVLPLMLKEKFSNPVWEPACGKGRISHVLEAAGYSVISTDLYDYGVGKAGIDFLQTSEALGDIVTNPPYNIMLEFAMHAVSLERSRAGKVALFLRLEFLCSVGRREFVERSPLRTVWVFSRRQRLSVPWRERKVGGVNYAWFIWDWKKKVGAPPEIRWIDKVE